ncbi:MAG: hypothetical protein ACO1O3_21035 [Sphingobium sp.]
MSILLAALLSAAIGGAAAAQTLPADPAQSATASALEEAQRRGDLIYAYDQAAWHTTDSLKLDIPDLRSSGIRGWIVTKVPNGYRSTYYGHAENGPYRVYSAVWTGTDDIVVDRIVARSDAEKELTAEERRLITAHDLVDAGSLKICNGQSFNVVVLPGRDAEEADSVYYLSPQTDADVYPFGGHHRVDVKDGKEVSRRAFSKGCLNMPRPTDKKGAPEAMVLSHLLDATPTEIHVFMARTIRLPVIVIISDRSFWAVDPSEQMSRITAFDPG